MKNTKRAKSPITIVIIEDHPIYCDGLVKLFEVEDGFHLLESATTAQKGIDAILTHQPQIAILDMRLPDGNGLDIARQIKYNLPNTTAIIILTQTEADRTTIAEAIDAGAFAYCHKSIAADQLIRVVRKVHEGYYYIDNSFMRSDDVTIWKNKQVTSLLTPYIQNARREKKITLSPRERDILKSVVQGRSNKEISLHLQISQQTVKNHMTSILNKLDVRDRTQAVITAIRHGWVNINNDEFIDF